MLSLLSYPPNGFRCPTIQHTKIYILGGQAPKPTSNSPAGKLIFSQIDDHKFSIFYLQNFINTGLLCLQPEPYNGLICNHTVPKNLKFLGGMPPNPPSNTHTGKLIFVKMITINSVTFLFKNLINTGLLSL